ncbi:vacuolar-processing enzyme alpha-isozyme-like [Vicia villosa]|uniref:vacuolar-processing enzyme alpha-isozyme-like n=1 Tax=Vicia villosa TaxID=3911 RepID=UPI00273AE36E|nr:vacuolar-processing enzyme alpha-isozyme-like [Vicia villosa]
MNYWIALIVTIWMSVMITNSEGVCPTKRWALLIATSKGYENYRHQADICHAYQILKSGGYIDENIIVMMYDDIAYNEENPKPGVIVNKPGGSNVYHGVPKDYTGKEVNVNNFFAVLTGNRNAIRGGSGKVICSRPNDTILIYIAGHGNAGIIAMPDSKLLWGDDFVDILKKKYDAKSYKKMVIYMESCLSGSMFEGLLPNNINVYATTSSSAKEDSYATYCPDDDSLMKEYTTCLGDSYSVSWMEDSDQNDRRKKTLKQQYYTVRNRVYSEINTHVMQYGDLNMENDFLVTYLGDGHVHVNDNDIYNFNSSESQKYSSYTQFNTTTRLVGQEDAHLLHLKLKLEKAQHGSKEKTKAQTKLDVEISHRTKVDHNVNLIWNITFGEEKNSTMMTHVLSESQPLVNDWDCLKMLVRTYEHHCGALFTYGLKYSKVFANMCNAGISKKQMIAATSQACPEKNFFKKIFSSWMPVPSELSFNHLSEDDSMWLDRPFSESEIKDVVWECDGNESSGPDGFSFEFFKRCWEIVKKDVFKFVDDFYKDATLLKVATSSFLTLIPKISNPQSLSDFRPICLVGSLHKILSKLMAARIKVVIGKLVAVN